MTYAVLWLRNSKTPLENTTANCKFIDSEIKAPWSSYKLCLLPVILTNAF